MRGDYEIGKFRNVNDNLKNESEKAFGIAVLNMLYAVRYVSLQFLVFYLLAGRLINSGQMMIDSYFS